ncbi:quinol-cytochrome oxidoreductase complex cytochrome b subunit [Rhodobium orientis]|nr:quinol-cytochrome oxidoreductase complex cytochrome b subunit [Rhodobium orientis]
MLEIEKYHPKSRLGRWVQSRLPVISLVKEQFIDFPTPKNLNYWWTFGMILTVMLVIQLLTGIVLAMHYTPHEKMAFDSIEHIMRDVNFGWLIRYMHANGASFFFLAVYVHIFRGLYYGSYRAPREVLWILGVLIYLVMMTTGFTGYVLPWGQMSFWAATVITSMFSAVPEFGEPIVQWLWGGFSVGNPTLQRFYSLHYLLPFIIAAIVLLHVWALHYVGSNNPAGVEPKTKQDTVPFTPHVTMKDLYAAVVFLVLFSWFLFFQPNYLGHPDNYIPADPLVTPQHIVPEWYYLPFYAMLRAVPDKLGGVLVMFASIIVLFFVPWLDPCKAKSTRYRPIYRLFFWVLVADCVFLGWLGSKPAEGVYVALAQYGTGYYFVHFIILLPILGLIERPKNLPPTISAAVLEDIAEHEKKDEARRKKKEAQAAQKKAEAAKKKAAEEEAARKKAADEAAKKDAAAKPADATKPADPAKPVAGAKPTEAAKPADEATPGDAKPVDTSTPTPKKEG